jgi:hypothetical protein
MEDQDQQMDFEDVMYDTAQAQHDPYGSFDHLPVTITSSDSMDSMESLTSLTANYSCEVRPSEERSDELITLALRTKAKHNHSFVRDAPPP